MYKFQQLRVYRLALEYVDRMYELASRLPVSERFNLCNQLQRAATSIVLNIAEGSTSQSDAEQNRFLGLALRSYLETIACLDIIEMRRYSVGGTLPQIRDLGHELFVRLQSFRKALRSDGPKTDDRGPETQGRLPSPVAGQVRSNGPKTEDRGPRPVSRPPSSVKASERAKRAQLK